MTDETPISKEIGIPSKRCLTKHVARLLQQSERFFRRGQLD